MITYIIYAAKESYAFYKFHVIIRCLVKKLARAKNKILIFSQ